MAIKYLIASGKGGVGKSSIVAGLSKALSATGKNVLCIDADVGLRSLDLLLSVGNDAIFNWGDLIEKSCDTEKAIVKTAKNYPDLLMPPLKLNEKITAKSFKEMTLLFDNDYDYIFIDAPAGISDILEITAFSADKFIIVANPDLVSVRSAAMAAEKLEEMIIGCDIRLIINRFDRYEVIENYQMNIDEVVDGTLVRLLGIIPDDITIKLMANEVKLSKNAKNAFIRIAERIEGKDVPLNLKKNF
ncbi:MAG: AAA family ATPase [Oscillospiraceae bacterium]